MHQVYVPTVTFKWDHSCLAHKAVGEKQRMWWGRIAGYTSLCIVQSLSPLALLAHHHLCGAMENYSAFTSSFHWKSPRMRHSRLNSEQTGLGTKEFAKNTTFFQTWDENERKNIVAEVTTLKQRGQGSPWKWSPEMVTHEKLTVTFWVHYTITQGPNIITARFSFQNSSYS